MRILFSRPAEVDLEAIGDFVSDDNPAAAAKLVAGLREAALSLQDYPRRFPKVAHSGRDELRKLSEGNYLIFYRIASGEVEIVRIVHAATDWVRLFA